MMQITIADNGFLPHTKSAFIGGDNIGICPTQFDWVPGEPRTARFVTDSLIYEASGPGQIAWLLEPFSLHPENYLSAMEKPFDAVLTHNRYFAANYAHRNWLWYPHGGSLISRDDQRVWEKTDSVSLLLSEKDTMAGHRLRHQIVERFGERIDEVLGLTERVRAVEAYAPFRYSIVVENERAPGYFTERLIDCLTVGTIPIYWGDPEINESLDGYGIESFENLDELDICLTCATPENYGRKKDSIQSNLRIAPIYAVCEDRIFSKYPHLFGG